MAIAGVPTGAAMGTMPLSPLTKILAWSVLFFLILPSLVVIPISFGDHAIMVFPPREYSLRLYHTYFTDPSWIATTLQSTQVALGSTVLALLLGTSAAYGIVRNEFRGKQLAMMFLLSPMFVPLIVVALGFYIYFSNLGLQGKTVALILAHTIYVTPFVIVVLMAALRGVDVNLEVAARTMGASQFYIFRRVTVPLIRPGIIAAGLFSFLLSFDELIVGVFLTSFDTKTLPVKMYESLLYEVSPVLAAVSTLLTLVAFVACLGAIAFQQRGINGKSEAH